MVTHLVRGSYWLALLHLPGLGSSDKIKAAEFRIPAVYPGDPQEALWDYRLLPGRRREYLLLAVIPRPKSIPRGGFYLPLFHAVDLKLPGRGEEVTLFEKGISDILQRSADDRYSLISREEKSPPLRQSPALPRQGYRGAFGGGEVHSLFQTALLSLLLVSSLIAFTAHHELQGRRSLLAQLETRNAAPENPLAEEISLKRLGTGKGGAPPTAVSARYPEPLGILRVLDTLLPPGTELLRLLCTEGRLQLELLGPAALGTAENLCSDSGFDEVRLGEIRPQKREKGEQEASGREIYRIDMRLVP